MTPLAHSTVHPSPQLPALCAVAGGRSSGAGTLPMAALALVTLISGLITPCAALAALPPAVASTPLPSLAPMVKRVSPAVVNIQTRGTVREQRNPLMDDPFFRRFFDAPEQPAQREFQSAGSGVVVDAKQGFIITNAHVIDNATEITVSTQDEHQFKAEVVGKDIASDVAVLRVKGAQLPELVMADSDTTEVGDFVVAIGNPFGLQHTVTSGIVSALGRTGINTEGYENFIQTDASINPGNSGGALVNLRGELVGINSAILSRSGGNIGIGFAIPSNMVKTVMDQLVRYGEVKRGILGVKIFTLTPDLAKGAGTSDARGALVSQVDEDSAAEKAGVKAGDVITAVNGHAIKSAGELRNAIGLLRVGQKIDLAVLRDNKPLRLSATINEGTTDATGDTNDAGAPPHAALEGVTLEDGAGGVRIQAVDPRSRGAASGLRPGDVISAVGRQRVDSVRALREALKGDGAFLLTVRRGTGALIIPLQ